MRSHHVVLLALAAPILGVGIVLWFLLPGSVSGLTYTPAQFDKDAILRPAYWTQHDVTISGFVRKAPCTRKSCTVELILGNTPARSGNGADVPDPGKDVLLEPQGESGWHHFLRKLVPGLVSSPVGPGDFGHHVTVTGRLASGYLPGRVPIILPNAL